jgi:peptide/nickel transport system permease protein
VKWYVARRAAFALFALYLVVSVTFGFIALTGDPNLGLIAFAAAQGPPGEHNETAREQRVQEAIREYKAARNLDDPLHERYAAWLVNVATFDWGESHETGQAVTAMLGEGLRETVVYLVPAVLLSVVVGIGAGVYSAIHRGSVGDYLAVTGGYLGFSLPNFWLAIVLGALLSQYAGWYGVEGNPDLTTTVRTVVLPAFVLSTALAAGQFRYARAESLEHVGSEFVKLVRAKGAGPYRVARHVLRNAALPLVALFFSDLLAVLVLSVFVLEAVFGIHGFGEVFYTAIQKRDLPVIMGGTLVVAFVGIGGNFLQDVLYAVLDPRVDTE